MLTESSSASFRNWQSTYAEHGIATFPVEFVPNGSGNYRKKPMVGRYGHMGLRASAKLAERFADVRAIGFKPGLHSGITVADVDEPGDAALARCLSKHGDTPVLVESTATGKHHAYYRFNSEKRIVRPEQDVALDILGHQDGAGNFVVAAPSVRPGGAYRFIRGSVADLGNLPAMRNVPRNALITSPEIDYPIPDDWVGDDRAPFEEMQIAPEGIRDQSLWTACMRALASGRVRSYEELIALARQWNAERCVPPQPEGDLMHAVDSAWDYTTKGKNYFGRPAVRFFSDQALPLIDNDPDLWRLVSFVRAKNSPGKPFILTNTFRKRWGWSRPKLAAVRKRAIVQGFLRCVRPAVSNHAALYVWDQPLNVNPSLSIRNTDSLYKSTGSGTPRCL